MSTNLDRPYSKVNHGRAHRRTTSTGLVRYTNVFRPLPWQKEALNDRSQVMLLTGSAGGGKSRCGYEKLHAFCLKYPGSTAVLFRKKREDAKKSAVLALEKLVIGDDPRVKHKRDLFRFDYWNGSVLLYVGVKDESARYGLRSIGIEGGIDIAMMEEAIEFVEEDYDEVLTRMRGTVAGWNQLILATNPDRPLHWINVRLIQGDEASIHLSGATDNPYNHDRYSENLDRTRSVTRSRLRDGLWVAGTGLVLDQWQSNYNAMTGEDKGGNVTLKADYIPGGGEVVMWADDGYAGEYDTKTKTFTGRSHPRVFLLVQIRSDGKFAVFYENYKIKTLAPQHIQELRDACVSNGWPYVVTADYDKAAASLEGELRDMGFRNLRRGPSSVDESLKLLNQTLAADENGVRRLIVHPRCRYLRLEMSSYSKDKDDRIIKEHDNGPDAMRYGVWNYIRGPGRPPDVGVPDELADQIRGKMDRVASVYQRLMRETKVQL